MALKLHRLLCLLLPLLCYSPWKAYGFSQGAFLSARSTKCCSVMPRRCLRQTQQKRPRRLSPTLLHLLPPQEMTNDASTASSLPPSTIVAVFVAGLIPFVVATIEFWRRIAVGAEFGTGTAGRVVFNTTATTTIGEDDAPMSSRGRRILGQDALIAAYVLFGISALVVGLVLYSLVTTSSATTATTSSPLLPPPSL